MEILVVMAIFSILGVVIINVFILALNSQRQVSLKQKSLNSVRSVLEAITRQARTGEFVYQLDYNLDDPDEPGIFGWESEVHFIDSQGRALGFYLDQDTKEVMMNIDGEESRLSDRREVLVKSLLFYISPVTDPFVQERCNDAVNQENCLLPNACTVDDEASGSRVGFCGCTDDADCSNRHCDLTERICLPFDQQPLLTIVIGFESSALKLEDRKEIFVQTSVSNRVYKR